jgi:hypothetical protein
MKATIVIALLLVYSVGQAFADPVVNSGFDTDLDGWTTTAGVTFDGSTAMLQVLPFFAPNGDALDPLPTITLSQVLTFSSTATISFDVKFDNGNNGPKRILPTDAGQPNYFQASWGYTTLMNYDLNGTYNPSGDIVLIDLGNGWYHFSQDIIQPTDPLSVDEQTLFLELYDRAGGEYYTTAWIDNVVLTENVTAVPEPSMLLLLGASITGFMSAGFLSMRRRKV